MFGKLLEAVVKTATLPVDVVCDAVNILDIDSRKEFLSNTRNKLESIEETIDEIGD